MSNNCGKCMHKNICYILKEYMDKNMPNFPPSKDGKPCPDFIGTSYDVHTHIWADVRGVIPLFMCGNCHESVAYEKFDMEDCTNTKSCPFCGAKFDEDPFKERDDD